MQGNKSRHKKFRGRTYIDDIITYLTAADWDTVVNAIQANSFHDKVDDTIEKLSETELHRIDVDHNSSGFANWRWNRVDIHTHVFHGEGQEAEFRDTLFHEIAHLIAYYGCDDQGHGAKWRKIFADLGYPHGKRCHSLGRLRGTTGKRRTRRVYVYECNGCGHETRRRRKFNDPKLWHHRGCTDIDSRFKYVREYRETI